MIIKTNVSLYFAPLLVISTVEEGVYEMRKWEGVLTGENLYSEMIFCFTKLKIARKIETAFDLSFSSKNFSVCQNNVCVFSSDIEIFLSYNQSI